MSDTVVNLTEDELAVVEFVLEGLRAGRHVYGPLDVEGDGRDFIDEALQELRDAMVYLPAQIMRLQRLREKLRRLNDE